MVRVVFAGGAGNVASEIIDVLVAEKKHDVIIFTRKNSTRKPIPGVTTVPVDYHDKKALVKALEGVHTVLSFIADPTDLASSAEKTLIDASIEAGVKRFAPSEWATRSDSEVSWYAGKEATRQYLEEVNREKKVLEYCKFQPGLFTNYFAWPHRTTKYLTVPQLHIDFENRRAIVTDGEDPQITLTTVQDLAKVVAASIDYEGVWPETGGIRGGQIKISKLLQLGAELRGKPFAIEKVKTSDLKAGSLKSSWFPAFGHPSVPEEQWDEFGKVVIVGSLLAVERGAWDVSDEWNKLLPELKLTGPESFLEDAWKGKPLAL